MGLLDGKVAIITGSGRGIGREHALLMAKEGAKVLVNDLGGDGRGEGADLTPAQSVVAEIEAMGGTAAVNGANVADWNGAQEMVQQAVDTFGRLDILVNNAGILRDRMTFNMQEDEWDAVLNVVLKGTFAPSRHAAAHWREQFKATDEPQNGVIITTTSESGLYSNGGQANYVAAKAGAAALAITMARDLQRMGCRVNSIAPFAATRLIGTVRPDAVQESEETDPDAYDASAPKQVAPMVAWLCSDEAKDITGQIFSVHGERIQLVQGFRPVTEIKPGGVDWTIDAIRAQRDALLGGRDTGVPPFLPPVGG